MQHYRLSQSTDHYHFNTNTEVIHHRWTFFIHCSQPTR